MIKKISFAIFLLLLPNFFYIKTSTALEVRSGKYVVCPTMTSGGGTSGSPSYKVLSAIGQPAISKSSSSKYQVELGLYDECNTFLLLQAPYFKKFSYAGDMEYFNIFWEAGYSSLSFNPDRELAVECYLSDYTIGQGGADDYWSENCQKSGTATCASGGETCFIVYDCQTSGTGCSVSCPSRPNAQVSNACSPDYSNCQLGIPACGIALGTCVSTASCRSTGNCQYTCDPGWHNYDGNDINGCESPTPTWKKCIPFPFVHTPDGGTCAVPNPGYNVGASPDGFPNNISCKIYDPNTPSLLRWENKTFKPIAFQVSVPPAITTTVGEVFALPINVKNVGLLTDNYTIAVITTMPNVVLIEHNYSIIRNVRTDDIGEAHARLKLLAAAPTSIRINVTSTTSCQYLPEGCISKEIVINIQGGIHSLPEFDFIGIIQIILIAALVLALVSVKKMKIYL